MLFGLFVAGEVTLINSSVPAGVAREHTNIPFVRIVLPFGVDRSLNGSLETLGALATFIGPTGHPRLERLRRVFAFTLMLSEEIGADARHSTPATAVKGAFLV